MKHRLKRFGVMTVLAVVKNGLKEVRILQKALRMDNGPTLISNAHAGES